MHRALIALALTSCSCNDGDDATDSKPPTDVGPGTTGETGTPYVTPPVADFLPTISEGEFIVGFGGQVQVGGEMPVPATPPNATVELYWGTHTAEPVNYTCDFGGGATCAAVSCLTDPSFVASGVTDANGRFVFMIPPSQFPTPDGIVWQARVLDPDPEDLGAAACTEAVHRHAAINANVAPVQFVDATTPAGLMAPFTDGNTHTGGLAFVDINNDWLPDIYVVNGAWADDGGKQPPMNQIPNRMWINAGNGTFVEDSTRAAKPVPAECAGVSFADVENDGDLDLLVPGDNANIMQASVPQVKEGGPNFLFINDGTGHFTETAAAAGVLDPLGERTSNGQFADFDRDGCVDMYLLKWAMAASPGADNFDRLLKGNCDGTFTDVTADFGIDPLGRDGLGMLWWDADFDLYPELWIANNGDRNEPDAFDPQHEYYKNKGGAALVEWMDQNETDGLDGWAGMGMDVGDIDGDLDWDMYMTDVWFLPPVPHGNPLYLGEPDGTLSANVCEDKNLCFGYQSWPTNFMDFDNDGWVDLWVGASLGTDPSMLYLNRGDGTGEFDPVRVLGWSGDITRAGTAADYDGDGSVDVFFWIEGATALGVSKLYKNTQATGNHWMELRLIGTDSNWAAIGAFLKIEAGGHTMIRRVGGGDSAHSQTDLAVHVGLGAAAAAERIEVHWPSGKVQELTNVAGDRFWLVNEDTGLVPEVLTDAVAVHDAKTQTTTMSVRSNYGGRPHLQVTSGPPMQYQWETITHTAVAKGPPPTEVTITSDLGGSITVPVSGY